MDPGNLNLECIPEIGQIYDFIINHEDYKDNLENYNGSEVADQVEDLLDNDAYMDIQNIECVNITYCKDNYEIIRFYPFAANTYCNDRCVLFSSSCDDIVNVDEDQQDRTNETSCDDGIDNDEDGLIDCDDFDCLLAQAQQIESKAVLKSTSTCSVEVIEDAGCIVLNSEYLSNFDSEFALWFCGSGYESDILSFLDQLGKTEESVNFIKLFQLLHTESGLSFLQDLDFDYTELLPCAASDPLYEDWLDLLNFNPSSNPLIQSALNENEWDLQLVSDANGPLLNTDYFALTFDPICKPDGSLYSKDELLEVFRLQFIEFTDDCPFGTSIEGFELYDFQSNIDIWSSSNPIGSAEVFTILGNSGSVILSQYSNSENCYCWTFTTITDNNGILSPGQHPVSGNRQFGLVDNPDGTCTFYTRGVDRAQLRLLEWMGVIILRDDYPFPIGTNLSQAVFAGGTAFWKCFFDNISDYLNSIENCDITVSELEVKTYRPFWRSVSRFISDGDTLNV